MANDVKEFLSPNGIEYEVVNPITGEKEIAFGGGKIPYIADNRKDFFLVYASFIGIMIKGLSLAEIKVFAYLLSTYNSGTSIALIKSIKQEIMDNTGLKSLGTISNTISSLTKTKPHPLLHKVANSTYKLNPRYAYKGSVRDRDNELKAIFELGCKDC